MIKLKIIRALDGSEKTDVNDILAVKGADGINLIPLTDIPPDWSAHRATDELNQTLAFLMNEGRAEIIVEEDDPKWQGTKKIALSQVKDLRLKYLNNLYTYEQSTKLKDGSETVREVSISKFELWLKDPYRREASRITMAPARTPGFDPVTRDYNLYQGWAYEPHQPDKTHSWALLRQHILEVIATGDERVAQYVMGWMAFNIQKPERVPEVALVLMGGEGTGKGTVATAFGALFGRHFVHLDKPGMLTGNFNVHMKDALLVFADENFFAGDHKDASALKTMITEVTVTIEPKFVNSYVIPNYRKFIIASNEHWVVPAGPDARRYAVFQVAEHKKDDLHYFQALFDQLKSGGYEAMLWDLQRMDLSNFDPRRFPQTRALFKQKKLGFDPTMQWWFDSLCRGAFGTELGWPRQLSRSAAHSQVDFLCVSQYEKRSLATRIGMTLDKVCPDIGGDRVSTDGRRERHYLLPPLDECRAAFERYTKTTIDWDTGEMTQMAGQPGHPAQRGKEGRTKRPKSTPYINVQGGKVGQVVHPKGRRK